MLPPDVPRRRLGHRLLFALTLAAPFLAAGCTSGPTIDPFDDATRSFTGATDTADARFEETYRYEVPNGTGTMRIGVAYRLDPGASLETVVRRSADGVEVGGLENLGPVEERDPSWFRLQNVTMGDWQIEVVLEGEGAFAFGVFLEGPDTPAS